MIRRRYLPLALSIIIILYILIFTASIYAQSAGLVSSWGFANDLVTDDINGCVGCVNNGAVWFNPSIVSGGYEFDGTNAYLNLGSFPYLNNQPAFSVSVWIRPDFNQDSLNWRYVFNDGANVALFFLPNNKDWRFSIRTTVAQYFLDTQGLTWSPGGWHMLTGTYNGTTMKLYWDAVQMGAKAATGAIAADTGATYEGASAIRSDRFDGAIDELKVYNRALTDLEISELYFSALGTGPTPTATSSFTPTSTPLLTSTPTPTKTQTPTPTIVTSPTSTPDSLCPFYPVGPSLNDLGGNEYQRLVSINPLRYERTGVIGGLYPSGSNLRPPGHEASGVSIASQVVPLDANGNPSETGKIGMVSVGMSNTSMEFLVFMEHANVDSSINPKLVLVNGAAGGGVIEAWVDPNHPDYQLYWSNFDSQITSKGLTHAQVQVAWIKITQLNYKGNFPQDMENLSGMYVTLVQMLKARLPNLKIAYFSSRTRSFFYFSNLAPETTAFENGFAVRWLIERQLNNDPALNYRPEYGTVLAPYLSWGPYLWIDGYNTRSDGRQWLRSYVNLAQGDCTHPSVDGIDYVVGMMMEFFKSDTTTIPWFINTGIPTPTPSPTPIPILTSTSTPIPTPTLTPTPGNATIFTDGFEACSLGAWSSTVTDQGDLSSTSAAALEGVCGMQALLDDTRSIYVQDDRPNADAHYHATFRFDPNSITMVSNNYHVIFQGYSASNTFLMRIGLRYYNGQYQIQGLLVTDGGRPASTRWITLSDAPHQIALDWWSATAPGANNGGMSVTVDGVVQASLSGLDNDQLRLEYIRWGAVGELDSGTAGTYYFDDFVSSR